MYLLYGSHGSSSKWFFRRVALVCSEFGIPSIPDMRTVNYWLGGCDEKQRYAQSKLMAQHNKAGSHERRFAVCLNDNFRSTADLEA